MNVLTTARQLGLPLILDFKGAGVAEAVLANVKFESGSNALFPWPLAVQSSCFDNLHVFKERLAVEEEKERAERRRLESEEDESGDDEDSIIAGYTDRPVTPDIHVKANADRKIVLQKIVAESSAVYTTSCIPRGTRIICSFLATKDRGQGNGMFYQM